MPFPKKKKQSGYMKSLEERPIKGLSSEHIPMKREMKAKKVKPIFGR